MTATRKPCIVCGELTWMPLCTRRHEGEPYTTPAQRMAEYKARKEE